jgi:ABC-type nitrate/sulfonate/bicarbonate transport system substrate-binding protein
MTMAFKGRPASDLPSRRAVLAGAAGFSVGSLVFGPAIAAPKPIVNITLSTPGSAGSIWRAAISMLDPALSSDFELNWVAGDPGQMQVQLAAGSLDVGVFGAIGLATLARRGSDITLFGPALNNHGRIIVKADSPLQKPADLVGKKIATQPKTTETYQQARVALSLLGIDMDRDFETIFGPDGCHCHRVVDRTSTIHRLCSQARMDAPTNAGAYNHRLSRLGAGHIGIGNRKWLRSSRAVGAWPRSRVRHTAVCGTIRLSDQ